MEHPKRDEPRGSDEPAKRPYARPELAVHGDVEKITEVLRLGAAKRFPDGTVIADD